MDFILQPWPWYVAGVLIAFCMYLMFYFGKHFGDEMIDNADDLCMYLLNTAHVSTVTGRAFGEPNCIRISFANNLEKIEEAYKRIKKALADLK